VEPFLGGDSLSSILDKAKRKTEEEAKKASNAARNFAHKAEDEAHKVSKH
jgi:vacuolar-type H+-ATPase subunit E/Vma4